MVCIYLFIHSLNSNFYSILPCTSTIGSMSNAVNKRSVSSTRFNDRFASNGGNDASFSGGDESKQKVDKIQGLKNSFMVRRNLFKLLCLAAALLSSGAITIVCSRISKRYWQYGMYSRMLVKSPTTSPPTGNIEVSVVILTYQRHELLQNLLPSVIRQNPANFEVIIVDNGCLPETKNVIADAFSKNYRAESIPFKYLPLCNNPGYAIGNNKGVEVASKQSKWIMFLNDDVILHGDNFFKNMIKISESRPNHGGSVCKLLTEGGEEVIEAGSIVWSDGHALGYGRGEQHINDPYISYAKPVDYGSAACLMIEKKIFVDYGGYDYKNFRNYYEDTDLQMHVQHEAGKEIWFQPTAIAYHSEHGSFNQNNAKTLMGSSAKRFLKKWSKKLEANHLENAHAFKKHARELQIMRASDLRARNPSKANILWLEQAAPNPDNGSGFGRAFDNLSVAAELGHKITVLLQQKISASWCNKKCRERISDLGVEMISEDWQAYVDQFIDFYDIVYISRPSIFQVTYRKWQELYKKHSFAVVYDCEALWYKRDELLFSLIQKEDVYKFPGGMEYFRLMESDMDADLVNLEIGDAKQFELNLIQMADSVLTVSERERDTIHESLPDVQTYTVGHIMSVDESRVTKKKFNQRNGILFLASFSDNMYYNGDAIWYFLHEVYPLVLQELEIPLTIAGRKIPKELHDLVEDDEVLSKNIIFRESVPDILELYDSARVFIAPHLYGAGIQYKVSAQYHHFVITF